MMVRVLAGIGFALLVAALAWAAHRWVAVRWDPARLAWLVHFVRTNRALSYGQAVTWASDQSGAPEWYVRWAVPADTYQVRCTEQRRNPLRTLNVVLGFIGGTILTVIPATAPAGALTLAAAGAVQAATPKTITRPCR